MPLLQRFDTFTSTSKIKSPYAFSVHMYPLLGLRVRTPFSTAHPFGLAFQPSRFFPLNSLVNPFGGSAFTAKVKIQMENKMRANGFMAEKVYWSRCFVKHCQ